MESKELKIDYIRNSHEESKELTGYNKKILKKETSRSHNEAIFEKEETENINYTLKNEDNHKNIFDHDITINYKPKRHRNLHMKKQISIYLY